MSCSPPPPRFFFCIMLFIAIYFSVLYLFRQIFRKNIGHLAWYCIHRQIYLLWLTLIFLAESICWSNEQCFLLSCPLCMLLYQWLLLVFNFCSAWHIMGVLGVKIMNCLMVVRTIAIIILNNFLLGMWKILQNLLYSICTVYLTLT